jgi:ribonuclease P protein component
MLKKIHRINKTRDFQKVYRTGKTVHTPALVIKFLQSPKFRAAFVVNKKVSKLAVERNRIKRAVREEVRLLMPSLIVGDYMLVAKQTATGFSNKDLRTQLVSALKKASLCVQS